jgi:hypothetical protein
MTFKFIGHNWSGKELKVIINFNLKF